MAFQNAAGFSSFPSVVGGRILTSRLVLSPFVGCQFACGRGRGLLAQPFTLPGQDILEECAGSRGVPTELWGCRYLFSWGTRNRALWFPVQPVKWLLLGSRRKSVGLFCSVSAPLSNCSSHSQKWPLLDYTKLIYHLQSWQNFFCPNRTGDVPGTWHPSALCLFRRKGWYQCPGAAQHQSTLHPGGCLAHETRINMSSSTKQ